MPAIAGGATDRYQKVTGRAVADGHESAAHPADDELGGWMGNVRIEGSGMADGRPTGSSRSPGTAARPGR